MTLVLNALCQSPISQGMTAEQAVRNTVDLAQTLDTLGYHRFWVAEHHSDPSLASGTPEVMMSHLASVTQHMRIGSGGMLMPYYSPLKVAEQFNLLSTLFPGRIDLGMGRAGGSEGHAAQALGRSSDPSFEGVKELLSWLGKGTSSRPYSDTFATPPTAPAEPWVLGTSASSALFAAVNGLPYAFGGFLDPRGLMEALQTYHQRFQPGWIQKPKVNVGWYVQAAATEKEAFALTRSSEHWFVKSFMRGTTEPFPGPDEIKGAVYAPFEEMAIQMRRKYALVGTADQVLSGLADMQKKYAIDEFTLVTIPFEHDARVASYAMLADAA